MADSIRVEVAVAWPEQQVVVEVELPAGSTVADAIRESALEQRFPDLDIRPDRIGIFGELCAPDRKVRAGERVELYRPLKLDPKQIRRLRAEAQTKKEQAQRGGSAGGITSSSS